MDFTRSMSLTMPGGLGKCNSWYWPRVWAHSPPIYEILHWSIWLAWFYRYSLMTNGGDEGVGCASTVYVAGTARRNHCVLRTSRRVAGKALGRGWQEGKNGTPDWQNAQAPYHRSIVRNVLGGKYISLSHSGKCFSKTPPRPPLSITLGLYTSCFSIQLMYCVWVSLRWTTSNMSVQATLLLVSLFLGLPFSDGALAFFTHPRTNTYRVGF